MVSGFPIGSLNKKFSRRSEREKNDDRYCWKNHQRQAKLFPLLWFTDVNFFHFISPRWAREYNKDETTYNRPNTPSNCEDRLCDREKVYNICFSGEIGSFGFNEHFDINQTKQRRVPTADAGSI
ncbi:unnamed protein product [Lactuca saligna]|uniref:Uncharacterized protein n=1 Tax=Lactuca saligna TaxID=75948 RepID=A0AA36EKY2_LACSI|nr:unnamed protein product [Lactuca saligna]